ncbi:MAG: outer membrane protein assembly factor BamA [Bacteroidales bacterium]|nr:outer membrane protein assembly factor BamA [Bacteroidales bacterium]
MLKQILLLLFLVHISFFSKTFAQEADNINFFVDYSSPKKYIIADIQISGVMYYDKSILIQLSGLNVGDIVEIPGEIITNAISKLWQHGLFSDVKITATKIVDDQIWLDIYLQELPRLSEVNYHGITKSENDDISEKVVLLIGSQVTNHQLNSAQRVISDFFKAKGFLSTEVRITQRNDTTQNNSILLDIHVDKKEKVKVNSIKIEGNNAISSVILERAMKKTNDKKLRNFLRTKKFLQEEYTKDKIALIDKFNEKGYRDAVIIHDTIKIVEVGKKKKPRVDIELTLEEGYKYYFGDIRWVGNTIFPSDYLTSALGIKKGDIFNQKILDKRLFDNDEGLNNLYLDRGYLFFDLNPIEVNINNDSIDYEMRIFEGKQATINKVTVTGNTKTNEHVALREVRTYPGDLFSKSLLMRSYRELAQLGHFDPEAINPDIRPRPEEGTVDIEYQLQEKANDQLELSGGWGQNMFLGSIGLRFANFSARNIFNKEAWRPLPTGDGQTLSVRYQTSGKYYKTISLSFIEPWLGGKKPNSLSVSLSHQKMNFSANNNSTNYYDYYGGSYYDYYGGGYYPGYSPQYNYESEDTDTSNDQIWLTTVLALGYGYRLSWPDDFFTVYHEASMEHYKLQHMRGYFPEMADENGETNGTFYNTSIRTVIGRNSVDNPLYSRSGSELSLSLKITPPFSLLTGKDYSSDKMTNAEKYRWIEYHKWVFKGRMYSTLSRDSKFVLHTGFEMGFLGYFNKNVRSPFEGFIVGGSGMNGYDMYGAEYIAMRGYRDGSLSPNNGSKIYTKFTTELRYLISPKPNATIYGLVFAEGGHVNSYFQDYNPYKLYRSAGIGARIFLPMFGLLGIDWGYGFDLPSSSEAKKGQFHFVLGQQF